MTKRNIIIAVGDVSLTIAWHAFRPELLFVNKTVSEEVPGGARMASIENGPMTMAESNFKGLIHETKGAATIYKLAGGKPTLRLTVFAAGCTKKATPSAGCAKIADSRTIQRAKHRDSRRAETPRRP